MTDFEHFAAPAGHNDALNLQRTCEFQAALLGMAGHDLRQPLQIIQSTFELLGAHGWLGSRVDTASERLRLERGERAIARMTEHLRKLIGALHLYEQTKCIEIAPVSLAPLLWRIKSENEDAAAEKGIDLCVCQTTTSILSNSVLLDSIVCNLVRNAVTYTASGGRILVGCRHSGADVRIDVYDTGIGIAPEHLPRIFEAFQRVGSTQADGLGIGLFIVRRAVDLLGHRIEVRSTVSRGSRFSLLARSAG